MKVTSAKIDRSYGEAKKATASVVLDDILAIHGLTMWHHSSQDRWFIEFPGDTIYGKHFDAVHPLNTDLREHILGEILKKYKERDKYAQSLQDTATATTVSIPHAHHVPNLKPTKPTNHAPFDEVLKQLLNNKFKL